MRSDISNLKDASARKRSLTDSANNPAETIGGEVVNHYGLQRLCKCERYGEPNLGHMQKVWHQEQRRLRSFW